MSPLAVGLFLIAAVYSYLWLGLIAWGTLPPLVLDVRPVLVTSGSMEPAIRVGDVVMITDHDGRDLAAGTVVTFTDPGRDGGLVTHRIVDVSEDGTYITRGDANRDPDLQPVAPEAIMGVGRILVPFVGRPLVWLRQGAVHLVAAWCLVTGLALAIRAPRAGARHVPQVAGHRGSRRGRRVGLLLDLRLRLRGHGGLRSLRSTVTSLVALAAMAFLGGSGVSAAAMAAITHGPGNAFATGTWPVAPPTVHHLHNLPTGAPQLDSDPLPPPTASSALEVMAAHPAAPPSGPLPAYSEDLRPGREGRWLDPSAVPGTPAASATWALPEVTRTTSIGGTADVELWVLRRGGGNPRAPRPVAVTLTAETADGSVLGSSMSAVWSRPLSDNNTWIPLVSSIAVPELELPSGARLVLTVRPIRDELAVAYGTADYPATVTVPWT